MKNKPLLWGVILAFLCSYSSFAQTATSSGAGEASGTNGTASFTIGQVNYQSYNSEYGSNTLGVQQLPIFSIITDDAVHSEVSLNAIVYPNPVVNALMLKIDQKEHFTYNYKLYNTNGLLLKHGTFNTPTLQISFNDLLANTYILKISDARSQKEIKTFTITKNQ